MASEAEVEAALNAFGYPPPEAERKRMRAALEAAERVREEEHARKIEEEEATERVRKVRAEFG
jgi:hypothetical protein